MIELTKFEKQWIKLCKGHYKEKYPFTGSWVDNLKPLFTEIYGWNPDEDNNYRDYLYCIFHKLLDIQFKISNDKSGHNQQLKNIFDVSFNKSISRNEELPIERAIAELCGEIQFNTVIENGVERYSLDEEIVILKLSERAVEKLNYIKGAGFIRDFPKQKPTQEWVGAVIDFLEEIKQIQ